jgi:hypothetical protein
MERKLPFTHFVESNAEAGFMRYVKVVKSLANSMDFKDDCKVWIHIAKG